MLVNNIWFGDSDSYHSDTTDSSLELYVCKPQFSLLYKTLVFKVGLMYSY